MYYLAVSAGEEAKDGFSGFSAQGLTRLQCRCVFSSGAGWGQNREWGGEGCGGGGKDPLLGSLRWLE